MKKIKVICTVAVFIILASVLNVEARTGSNNYTNDNISPPHDWHESPVFTTIEELFEWIESIDALAFQGGRFYDALRIWRSRGQVVIPYFRNDEIALTSMSVSKNQDNMTISFRHATPLGQVIARVGVLNQAYVHAYNTGGVINYFNATRGNEFQIANTYEKLVSIIHGNSVEIIPVSYVLVDELNAIDSFRFAFTLYVLDGLEVGLTYHTPYVIKYLNYLEWEIVPITNRSGVLESNMSLLSPGTTLRFTTGTPLFTIDLAPFHGIAQPFIDTDHNRTMIPLRTITDAFGLPAEWDSTTRTARVQIGDNWHYIPYGTPLPDGLGTPIIRNDRIFLPLRYIADLLDAEARWDSNSRSAYIYMP